MLRKDGGVSNPRALLRSVGHVGLQQDADHALRGIFNLLDMNRINQELHLGNHGLARKPFGFFMKSLMECTECRCQQQSMDLQLSLDMETVGSTDAGAALLAYQSPEILKDYFCRSCGVRDKVERSLEPDGAPENLIVQAKRFPYNANGHKLVGRFDFPESLIFGGREFGLKCFLVHSGLYVTGGHWFALARAGDAWLRCSDLGVTWHRGSVMPFFHGHDCACIALYA